MARFALGIDVGTSGVKGVLIEPGGRLVAEAYAPHDLRSSYPGWSEEDPAEDPPGRHSLYGDAASQPCHVIAS